MLKLMRKNTKIIIWAVILSFILWGGFTVGVQMKNEGQHAGEVFGKKVSFQDYDRFYKGSQIFSFGGQTADDPETLKYRTWQYLIYSREAKRLSLKADDQEVRAEITKLFKNQGVDVLTPEIYESWLKRTVRMSAHEFEKLIREFLKIEKLIQLVLAEPADEPSDEELQQTITREETKVELSWGISTDKEIAHKFQAELEQTKDWPKTAAAFDSVETFSPGLLTVRDLKEKERVPTLLLENLLQKETPAVTEPVPFGKGYAVFYLAQKQDADLDVIRPEKKEDYLKMLKEIKKQQHFWEWNFTLMQKANLKDYLPDAQTNT